MKMLPLLHLVELRGMLSISLLRLLWSIQTSTADLWKSSRIFLWRRTVPSAKWITEKRKQPRSVTFLCCLCVVGSLNE